MTTIRIALPKGPLLNDTAAMVRQAGWELSDYSEGARLYHLTSARFPDLQAKIFHEKDIPIQVAIGNYDLGICGLDWIQELTVKYPASALVKVMDLGYGRLSLFLSAAGSSRFSSLDDFRSRDPVTSIASEYPNLAESLALNGRFKRFNIFPVWGAAEIYPPENADLALIAGKTEREIEDKNLVVIARVLDSSAYLIANQTAWETKDLSRILQTLYVNYPGKASMIKTDASREDTKPEARRPGQLHNSNCRTSTGPAVMPFAGTASPEKNPAGDISLALPDGHAQKHVVNILQKARIGIKEYPSSNGSRRPEIDLPGISIKVIRPQDMPLQVADGKFDIAITGQDWLKEHLYKFPSSPVTEVLDLKYSRVKIVAAVHNDLPVNDIAGLSRYAAEKELKLRVASEYTSIADKYARDHHLGMYRIIPTWGATEAFLPDDADMLIENTETGGTIKRHNLKIIDTLFESTACLIVNTLSLDSPKAGKIRHLAGLLRQAVDEQ